MSIGWSDLSEGRYRRQDSYGEAVYVWERIVQNWFVYVYRDVPMHLLALYAALVIGKINHVSFEVGTRNDFHLSRA